MSYAANGPLQLFPLLRIIVFLIGGIVAGDLLYEFNVIPWLLGGLFILFFLLWIVRNRALLSGGIVCLLVFCLGAIVYTLRMVDTHRCPLGVPLSYRALVVSVPKEVGKVVRCRLLVVEHDGVTVTNPYEVNASFLKSPHSNEQKIADWGSGVEVVSIFKGHTKSTFKSHFSYHRWALANDILCSTFVPANNWQQVEVADLYSSLPMFWKFRLQMQLLQQRTATMLETRLRDNHASALLRAVILGDKSGLQKADKTAFSVAGVSHVLALSGLHLSIIYVFLSFLLSGILYPFRRSVAYPFLVQLLLLLTIWVYVFLVGMSASILRSAIMLSVYGVVSLLNRDKMSLNTLSFAGIVMLLYNPFLLWDVGFQLSFVAVLSIFIFYPFLYSILSHRTTNKALLWCWSLLSVSLSAQVGTAPLIAYYFERFSNYFLLANMIVIPLITAIMYIAVVFLLLHSFFDVSEMLVMVLNVLTRWLTSFVEWISVLPYSSIEEIHVTALQVGLLYVLIACCYGLCRYVRKIVHFHRQFKHV